MSANAKNEYTMIVEDDIVSPQACAGQMVRVRPDAPLVPNHLVVIKLRNGSTIIRRFVRHDRGDDKIGVETLQPKRQIYLLNLDRVESGHRVVMVGDPWPEDATPKPPPAG